MAELGTRPPTPGPLQQAVEALCWLGWGRVGWRGLGEGRYIAGGLVPGVCGPRCGAQSFYTSPVDVTGLGQGQLCVEEGPEVTKVFTFQFPLPQRCVIVPKPVLLEASRADVPLQESFSFSWGRPFEKHNLLFNLIETISVFYILTHPYYIIVFWVQIIDPTCGTSIINLSHFWASTQHLPVLTLWAWLCLPCRFLRNQYYINAKSEAGHQ